MNPTPQYYFISFDISIDIFDLFHLINNSHTIEILKFHFDMQGLHRLIFTHQILLGIQKFYQYSRNSHLNLISLSWNSLIFS
jgi:hypothetical protein